VRAGYKNGRSRRGGRILPTATTSSGAWFAARIAYDTASQERHTQQEPKYREDLWLIVAAGKSLFLLV